MSPPTSPAKTGVSGGGEEDEENNDTTPTSPGLSLELRKQSPSVVQRPLPGVPDVISVATGGAKEVLPEGDSGKSGDSNNGGDALDLIATDKTLAQKKQEEDEEAEEEKLLQQLEEEVGRLQQQQLVLVNKSDALDFSAGPGTHTEMDDKFDEAECMSMWNELHEANGENVTSFEALADLWYNNLVEYATTGGVAGGQDLPFAAQFCHPAWLPAINDEAVIRQVRSFFTAVREDDTATPVSANGGNAVDLAEAKKNTPRVVPVISRAAFYEMVGSARGRDEAKATLKREVPGITSSLTAGHIMKPFTIFAQRVEAHQAKQAHQIEDVHEEDDHSTATTVDSTENLNKEGERSEGVSDDAPSMHSPTLDGEGERSDAVIGEVAAGRDEEKKASLGGERENSLRSPLPTTPPASPGAASPPQYSLKDEAVVEIQRVWRGYTSRRSLEMQTRAALVVWAASTIQQLWRQVYNRHRMIPSPTPSARSTLSTPSTPRECPNGIITSGGATSSPVAFASEAPREAELPTAALASESHDNVSICQGSGTESGKGDVGLGLQTKLEGVKGSGYGQKRRIRVAKKKRRPSHTLVSLAAAIQGSGGATSEQGRMGGDGGTNSEGGGQSKSASTGNAEKKPMLEYARFMKASKKAAPPLLREVGAAGEAAAAETERRDLNDNLSGFAPSGLPYTPAAKDATNGARRLLSMTPSMNDSADWSKEGDAEQEERGAPTGDANRSGGGNVHTRPLLLTEGQKGGSGNKASVTIIQGSDGSGGLYRSRRRSSVTSQLTGYETTDGEDSFESLEFDLGGGGGGEEDDLSVTSQTSWGSIQVSRSPRTPRTLTNDDARHNKGVGGGDEEEEELKGQRHRLGENKTNEATREEEGHSDDDNGGGDGEVLGAMREEDKDAIVIWKKGASPVYRILPVDLERMRDRIMGGEGGDGGEVDKEDYEYLFGEVKMDKKKDKRALPLDVPAVHSPDPPQESGIEVHAPHGIRIHGAAHVHMSRSGSIDVHTGILPGSHTGLSTSSSSSSTSPDNPPHRLIRSSPASSLSSLPQREHQLQDKSAPPQLTVANASDDNEVREGGDGSDDSEDNNASEDSKDSDEVWADGDAGREPDKREVTLSHSPLVPVTPLTPISPATPATPAAPLTATVFDVDDRGSDIHQSGNHSNPISNNNSDGTAKSSPLVLARPPTAMAGWSSSPSLPQDANNSEHGHVQEVEMEEEKARIGNMAVNTLLQASNDVELAELPQHAMVNLPSAAATAETAIVLVDTNEDASGLNNQSSNIESSCGAENSTSIQSPVPTSGASTSSPTTGERSPLETVQQERDAGGTGGTGGTDGTGSTGDKGARATDKRGGGGVVKAPQPVVVRGQTKRLGALRGRPGASSRGLPTRVPIVGDTTRSSATARRLAAAVTSRPAKTKKKATVNAQGSGYGQKRRVARKRPSIGTVGTVVPSEVTGSVATGGAGDSAQKREQRRMAEQAKGQREQGGRQAGPGAGKTSPKSPAERAAARAARAAKAARVARIVSAVSSGKRSLNNNNKVRGGGGGGGAGRGNSAGSSRGRERERGAVRRRSPQGEVSSSGYGQASPNLRRVGQAISPDAPSPNTQEAGYTSKVNRGTIGHGRRQKPPSRASPLAPLPSNNERRGNALRPESSSPTRLHVASTRASQGPREGRSPLRRPPQTVSPTRPSPSRQRAQYRGSNTNNVKSSPVRRRSLVSALARKKAAQERINALIAKQANNNVAPPASSPLASPVPIQHPRQQHPRQQQQQRQQSHQRQDSPPPMSVHIETEDDATAADSFITPHQVPVDIAPSEGDVIEQEERQKDGRTEDILQQGEKNNASKGTTAAKNDNTHRRNGSQAPNSDGDRTATPVVVSSPPPPTVFISCAFGPGQIGLRLEEDKADKDGARNGDNTRNGGSGGNTHSADSGNGSGRGEGGDGGVRGVWVNGCVPGSVAAKAAILAQGDRLVTINALDVQDLSLSGVHELLASTPRPVNMTFARGGGRGRGERGEAEMRPSLPAQEQEQHEDVHAFTDEDVLQQGGGGGSGSGGASESRGAGEDVEEGDGMDGGRAGGGNSDTARVNGGMDAASVEVNPVNGENRNSTNTGKKRTIRVRRPSFNSPPPSTGQGSSAKLSPFEAANPKELIRSITSPSPDTAPGGSRATEDGQGSADVITDAITASPNGQPNEHTNIDQQHYDPQPHDSYRDENTYAHDDRYDDRNTDLQEGGQQDEQHTIEEVAEYDRHFTGWDKRNDDYRGVRQEEERGRQREKPRPLRQDGAPRPTAGVSSSGRVTHRPFVAASRTLSVFSRPDGSPPDRHYTIRTGTRAGTRSMSPVLPPSRRRVEGRQGDGDGQQQQQQQQRVVGGRGGGGEREGGGRSHSASPVTAAVRVLMEAGVLQELGCKCKCTHAAEHCSDGGCCRL